MTARSVAKWVLGGILVVGAGIYFNNASWRGETFHGKPKLIAHRGLHQTFDLEGVTNDTCTARRIREPIAPEIENTIGSMKAAFSLGAQIVELDVHPTTDGKFAIFHDWTLDCRTDGTGPTRDHDLPYLKTLDIGYGYTPDGGKTFPLRGKGVGLMPSFSEVMKTFPQGQFMVNFKSGEAREGDMLAKMLDDNPQWRDRIWGVYGGAPPTDRAVKQIDGLRGVSGKSLKACLLPYIAIGWTGAMPEACRDTIIFLPINVAPLLWGWPELFVERFRDAGSAIVLRGPYWPGEANGGIDTAQDAARLPDDIDVYIWTNEIALIAPLLGAAQSSSGN